MKFINTVHNIVISDDLKYVFLSDMFVELIIMNYHDGHIIHK